MISFIIATIGRPSLQKTLASIECWPGDEIIVVGEIGYQPLVGEHVRYIACPPGCDWGSTERNIATPLARGQYLAHIDDDDVYVPGGRQLMADAIADAPGRLSIFKMRYPSGGEVWKDRIIRWGNVGTPMMLQPNDLSMMGRWGEKQDCGDFHFLQTMKWPHASIAWREDVIALISQLHGA